MREDLARRARRDVIRAAHEGVDWVTMTDLIGAAIRRAVPFGFHCWGPIDPATLLLTGAVARDATAEMDVTEGLGLLPRLEYGTADVTQWAFLARPAIPGRDPKPRDPRQPRAQPTLPAAAATPGPGARAARIAGQRRRLLGAMGLYRGPGQPDFDNSEARFLAGLSAPIADGFRRSLLLTTPPLADLPDGPGLLVLDHRGDLESVTAAALRWIEELDEPGSRPPLPMVVRAVATRARHAGDNHPRAPESTRSRAATRSGRWLVVHAMRMHGAGTGRIAVVIEPAHPHEAAPLIIAAYGLSDRERAVTQLVLQGIVTGEIAQRLHISPLTVQDHLKQIFDKTGVRSRRHLVTRVFYDHYWPAIQQRP